MSVRAGAMVGWIGETQRETKGCGLKEGCDDHYILFLSQTKVEDYEHASVLSSDEAVTVGQPFTRAQP